MYHFSLNLLRDPLNWLTNWADGTESYESEEICGRLRSRWLRLMFWGPRHGRQVIWGKGQLVVFLPFYFSGDQYRCTKFSWTGHWSITTLPSCTSELARSRWQAGRHTVPLFSAQGHVFTFPVLLYKSHIHRTKTSLHFYDTYIQFSVVRVIWVSSVQPGAHIICSEWLPGNVGSQRRDVSTSLLCSLVKSLCSQVDEEPRLILQIRTFCNIAWSDCNLIDLPAPPLDLIRSMLSPWSRPAEMDNCGGATTNCLPCEALTCLYLLGLQCRFGKRWQCVCASACVCVSVAGAGGIRVTVQFSEPPSAARGDGKKKRERQQNEGGKRCFSTFTSLCFTILPKQVSRGCRRRWQLIGWQIHWRKRYRKKRKTKKEGEVAAQLIIAT